MGIPIDQVNIGIVIALLFLTLLVNVPIRIVMIILFDSILRPNSPEDGKRMNKPTYNSKNSRRSKVEHYDSNITDDIYSEDESDVNTRNNSASSTAIINGNSGDSKDKSTMFRSSIKRINPQRNKITKFTQLSLARMHVTSYNLDGCLPNRIGDRRKDAIQLLGKYNNMHFHYSTDKSIYAAIDASNNSKSLNRMDSIGSNSIKSSSNRSNRFLLRNSSTSLNQVHNSSILNRKCSIEDTHADVVGLAQLSSRSLQRLSSLKTQFFNFTSNDKDVILNLKTEVSLIIRDSFERLHQSLLSYIREGIYYGLLPPKKLKETWDIILLGLDKNDPESVILQFRSASYWIDLIETVLLVSLDELHLIKGLSNELAGAELIRQFFIDIMGRNTLQSNMFESKSGVYYQYRNITPDYMKTIAMFVVILINIFALYVCISYAMLKGHTWQRHWTYISFVAIFFVLVCESTFESLMVGYVIPSQILVNVRSAQATFNRALVDHMMPGKDTQQYNQIRKQAK